MSPEVAHPYSLIVSQVLSLFVYTIPEVACARGGEDETEAVCTDSLAREHASCPCSWLRIPGIGTDVPDIQTLHQPGIEPGSH